MKGHIKIRLWALTVNSSLLLSVPYEIPLTGLVALVAFLPLLAAEHLAAKNNIRFFWLNVYVCFLIWNAITTYWIYLATLPGAIAAITLNSLQMAVIFIAFRWCKKRFRSDAGYLALILFWVAWEHFYYTWQISWPWLTLGNAFATSIRNIQWYSLTGTLGGSFWILSINVLIFLLCRNFAERKRTKRYAVAFAALLFIPLIYSNIRFCTYRESGPEKEIVVLQPNIDPYSDKFSGMTQTEQDDILFGLAREGVTDSTYMMVAPETFINPDPRTGRLYENSPESNMSFMRFREFSREHNVNFIFGAVTHFIYKHFTHYELDKVAPPTPTARRFGFGQWLEVYNTAVQMNNFGDVWYYHKSKLVILAESTPVVNGKNVMKSFGIDLGGQIGSFATQPYRTVFKSSDETICGTAICYESVFGDFYREYINNGAQFMTIITNDGWWGNTFGHRQHLSYASLRAIETRRDIARSANTGISAFINQKGEIITRNGRWKREYLRGNVTLNDKITPFVRYGDVTGCVSAWGGLILLIAALFNAISGRRKKTGR